MHASAFGRVAVLMGGTSAEREISLLTGAAVQAALLQRGVDSCALDTRGLDLPAVLGNGKFDRVWIALHGRGGEDGSLQGLLETLAIPYTGSGVLGSALAMDKLRAKQLLSGIGLATPPWRPINALADCDAAGQELGFPLIIKPALEGSSLGMTKVTAAEGLAGAWHTAAAFDSEVFAERWISGPEYTAAILHDQVLPLIRVDAQNETFYDYQAKYFSDQTRYICPCGLARDAEERLAAIALQAFKGVGASGWGRVDFMLDGDSGRPQILEINTVPGMTSHSLVPMAAAQAGIDFGGLVWRILETSFRFAAVQEQSNDAA